MKKNVASQTIGAQMVAAADGSAFTSAVSCFVTGDAGTQGAGGGAVTHEGNGYHSYAPTQAETNYDHVAFTFTGTGAIPATVQVYTEFPQTGDAFARLGAPAGASVSADVAAVKAETSSIQTDTNDIQTRLPAALVGGRMDSSVGAMAANVITAAATAADYLAEINAEADTALFDVGVTAIVTGRIDAAISTRLAAAGYTAPLDAAGTRAAVGLAAADLDAQLGAIPTAAENADAIWDEAIAGHLGAGSTGLTLNSAGAAGDPWSTALPGAYGAGTAGKIIGDNINAPIATVDTVVDAIKAKTDNLPANPAATTDIPTGVENADALLGRNVSGGSSAGRTVKQALHVLRNKTDIAGGTLTVYDTDDATPSFTAAVTTAAGNPITSIDPA